MEEKIYHFFVIDLQEARDAGTAGVLAEAHGQSTKCFAKRLNREETLLGEGRIDVSLAWMIGLRYLPRASHGLAKAVERDLSGFNQTLQTALRSSV